MLTSSPELAARLGCDQSTVRRLCAALGIPPVGRNYALTEDECRRIKAAIKPVGRPPVNRPR